MTCDSCTDASSWTLAAVAWTRKYSTQTVSGKFWLLIVVY